MFEPLWDQIEAELRRAEAARGAGNEGRARVCARRAAGMALREAFRRRGEGAIPGSAVDLLRAAPALPGISERACAAAERLLQKVDEEFNLPRDWDLLAEARELIAEVGRIP